jgi:hypothetical protein
MDFSDTCLRDTSSRLSAAWLIKQKFRSLSRDRIAVLKLFRIDWFRNMAFNSVFDLIASFM